MKKGFSVIEVLIVLGVFSLIFAFTFLAFSNLNNEKSLESATELVLTTLREAQSLTLSSKESSQYGVRIESDKLILFKGSQYNPAALTNTEFALGLRARIRNINLNNGGSDIVFARLTGATANYGSLEVYLISSSTTVKVINISATGIIDVS